MEPLKYKEITGKVIGASFEVHKFLGGGFKEAVYLKALEWELAQEGVSFEREIEKEIMYKDIPWPIGRKKADFIVEEKVLVELKARPQLDRSHLGQALAFLRVFHLDTGLLINFGGPSLEFRRLIYDPSEWA